MGHGHGHSHGPTGARHAGRLRWSFAVTVTVMVVQVVVGLATGSLALLSDAGHMATDALGSGMALAAVTVAMRPGSADHRTFGLYRLEILAALANAVLLFGVAGWVLLEAARRLGDPPPVAPWPVLGVGAVGLVANLVAAGLLRGGAAENLNVRGAYVEVLADTLGSVGVIVAAVVMAVTGRGWVDPVVGAAIGVFILPRAWRLGRSAVRILVQAAPAGLDVTQVRAALAGVEGVSDVHDLHVWTLTSGMEVLSAHLVVTEPADAQAALRSARSELSARFSLDHATLQVETLDGQGCDELSW